jgi:serine/threonine protein kinase/WD40 repeat protein
MNGPSSPADPDDLLFAEFLLDLEKRGPDAVADWEKRHPRLAGRIREELRLLDAIDESRPAQPEQLPAELGNYRILRRLHGGGMGEIYLAEEKYLENQGRWPRRVAVKVIRRGRESMRARTRFLREQRVLAHLHQTHIVSLFHAAEEGRWQYFVMPYIDGAALDKVVGAARAWETGHAGGQTPTLATLASELAPGSEHAPANAALPQDPTASLSRVGAKVDGKLATGADQAESNFQLSPAYFRSVAETMADAAEAVHHVHKTGLLHRDLKPSNIMIDRSGRCCVIDFGLAGYLHEPGEAKASRATLDLGPEPMTATGILGTPQYMAPEQWTTGRADVRGDVWSLGATLYELLTLHRAFDGETRKEIQTEVLKTEPEPPLRLVPHVPRDLAAICLKALQKKPEDRYASAGEMALDLQRWLKLEPTVARPARTPRRLWWWSRRNPGWAVAIVMAVFALLFGAAWAIGDARQKEATAEQEKAQAEIKAIQATQHERNQEAHRQELMRGAQELRLKKNRIRWTKDAWDLLGQAALIRVDDTLRNEAATSLIGLDLVNAKQFKDAGASALAFDAAGMKLLMGAHGKRPGEKDRKEIAAQPIRIWDKATDQVRKTTIFHPGPVTFDAKDRPLALSEKAQDPSTLVLWDLDKEQPLREFALPPKIRGQLVQFALSANGGKVAAIVALEADKSLVVAWDAATGNVQRQQEKKSSNALALSPDGTMLAVGDNDGWIDVWSFDKLAPTVQLKCGRLAVAALAFGPNPKKAPEESPWVLASGDKGGTILIWELADRLLRTKCPGSLHDIYALAFNHDGTRLASGGRFWPRVWNALNGQLLFELDHHDFVTALAFSPDGTHLAAGNPRAPFSDFFVRVWQLENGRGLQTLDGLGGPIAFVELSHDGSRLAALSHLWEIGVWDLKSGKLLQVFPVPPGYLADNAAIALSGDNRYLAFTSGTNAVMWDLKTGKHLKTETLPRGMVDQVAWHPGLGKFISFRVETEKGQHWPFDRAADFRQDPRVGRLREWSLAGIKSLGVIKDFNKSVSDSALARNASILLVKGIRADDKGETEMVRAYALPAAKEIWSGSGHANPVSPDGKFHLYFAVEGGVAVRPKLLDFGTGKTEDLPEDWPIVPDCLGPEGNYAASSVNEQRTGRAVGLKVQRRGDKTPLVVFGTRKSGSASQFNLAGTHLAWGTTDGSVIVCDLAETQRRLAALGLGW